MGNTPHSQLLPLLQASDLFVLASTQEGLPLSAGEAMALGVAPLTTTAGGLIDLIEPKFPVYWCRPLIRRLWQQPSNA
jgi:glycosyltransferase involved in cell wall biosynthesis